MRLARPNQSLQPTGHANSGYLEYTSLPREPAAELYRSALGFSIADGAQEDDRHTAYTRQEFIAGDTIMPFMRRTEESDRIWECDGLEIYAVKCDDGRVQIKIRSPGKPKERAWRILEGHFTRYGVEVSFEHAAEDGAG
jgi:hypothetical protein